MNNVRIIPFTITNGKKKEILEKLKNSNLDDKVEISEIKKQSKFLYKIKFIWFSLTNSIKLLLRRIKEFVKYRKLEPMFGGGSSGLESFYGPIFDFVTIGIPHGIAFNILILITKKSYNSLKTKRKKYIVFVSMIRQPFDCRIKILIPNNLKSGDLDFALEQTEELFINIDNIRNYFGNREIKIKYIRDGRWKIKFK